ncbi:sodium channel protein Nach-like isoform X2 [Drosophila suzukii]
MVSGWNMVTIFILLKNRYETDSTSIGVSTAYSRWTNTFPSIGVCLSKSRINKEFTEAVQRRFPGKKQPYTYTRTLYDYLFITPNNLYIKPEYCPDINSSCGVDILDMRRELFPTNCSSFLEKIYFAEVLLPDCEKIFKFHELEMGYCFLANNFMDYDSTEDMPLQYTSLDKYRNLRLVLRSGLVYGYELFIHSPEDLPYFNAISYGISGDTSIHSFNVEEIHNHENVIEEPISQRLCKFPSESTIEGLPYSFSICMSLIRSEIEMELCNCTLFSHKDRSSKHYCGVANVSCLEHGKLAEKVKSYVGSHMACLPSCMEQQISLVGSRDDKSKISEEEGFVVEVQIASAPTARYYRTVTQTKLDLIVGIGSVIGLFFGASLLNILEISSYFVKKIKTMILG